VLAEPEGIKSESFGRHSVGDDLIIEGREGG
jgi:hypothetical protein